MILLFPILKKIGNNRINRIIKKALLVQDTPTCSVTNVNAEKILHTVC